VVDSPLSLTGGREQDPVPDPKIVEALIDVLRDNDLKKSVTSELVEMGVAEPRLLLPILVDHLNEEDVRRDILRILMKICEREPELSQYITQLFKKRGLNLEEILKDILKLLTSLHPR